MPETRCVQYMIALPGAPPRAHLQAQKLWNSKVAYSRVLDHHDLAVCSHSAQQRAVDRMLEVVCAIRYGKVKQIRQ